MLASAFAPTFGVSLGLRVMTGLSGGMTPPNSMAGVADVIALAKSARACGVLMAVASLAGGAGVPAVAVVANAGGWKVPFLMNGSLLLVCAVLRWFWYPKLRNRKPEPGTFSFISRYKQMVSIGLFRSVLAANFLQRIAFYWTFSYLAAYLISEHGFSFGETAAPLAIVGMGVLIGSFTVGSVVMLKRRAQVVAGCALAGGLTSLSISPSAYLPGERRALPSLASRLSVLDGRRSWTSALRFPVILMPLPLVCWAPVIRWGVWAGPFLPWEGFLR